MNLIQRIAYRTAMLFGRSYSRLFFDMRVWGLKGIPKGPKIYVHNHITANDPFYLLPLLPDYVHVVVGPGYNIAPLAWLLDRFEQINAMPEHRATVVDQAVQYLRKGKAIYIAPEGDLQDLFRLGRFYPGAATIYRRSRVPIIPIALVAPKRHARDYRWLANKVKGRVYRAYFMLRGTCCINIGSPFAPEIRENVDEKEDVERINGELKRRIQRLVDEIRLEKFWLK